MILNFTERDARPFYNSIAMSMFIIPFDTKIGHFGDVLPSPANLFSVVLKNEIVHSQLNHRKKTQNAKPKQTQKN